MLTKEENDLYGLLMILSREKTLSYKELIDNIQYLNKLVKLSNESVKKIIDYYQEVNGVSKTDSKTLTTNENDNWFNSCIEQNGTTYLDRYFEYLLKEKHFSANVVKSIKNDLFRTCRNFACPQDKNIVVKKGLVCGDVQSGKTANYIGLINLAVDVGYKNIVLLTGTTENLRIQTQKRVDSGFVGAKSATISKEIQYDGVGVNSKKYFAITYTDEVKDFVNSVISSVKTNEEDLNKPRVFVIKKNKRVLTEINNYLKKAERSDSSLLIVDDECDYASINTKSKEKRTAINGLIGTLFNLYKTTTYVGYTATPYANIFIDKDDTPDNIDLFPNDFIVLLEPPDNYIGGLKTFRKWTDEERKEYSISKKLYGPHIKLLDENESNFLPTIHKIEDEPQTLPNSLKEAICSFLIANCIRTLKGDVTQHRSMLVNISRFNDIQEKLKKLIEDFVIDLKNAIEQTYKRNSLRKFLNSDLTQMVYNVWSKNDVYFSNFGEDLSKNIKANRTRFSWNEIQSVLYDEIIKFETAVVNFKHKLDRYDYDSKKDIGSRVIVIGGFSLSRGLTLEGLMTSYYNRNAGAYDVLLQMGRWFGYRPNYEELCMLFMTQNNVDCFNAAIDATEELKNEFRKMAEENKTPNDFGLAVRKSPSTLDTNLLVTARNKCKGSVTIIKEISLGGKVIDTSKIYKDKGINYENQTAVVDLLEKAKYDGVVFTTSDADAEYEMLKNVDFTIINNFLKKTKFPLANKKFDKEGIINIICKSDSLKKWDVVFAKGNKKETPDYCFGKLKEKMVYRSFTSYLHESFIRISDSNNRLADPNLFRIGLSREQYETLNTKKDGKTALKAEEYLNFERNPLLIIYPISIHPFTPDDKNIENKKIFDGATIEEQFKNTPVIGIALGFPGKTSDTIEAEYLYNKQKINEILSEENNEDLDDDFVIMEESDDDEF